MLTLGHMKPRSEKRPSLTDVPSDRELIIRERMLIRRVSFADVARRLGCNRAVVRRVATGERRALRIERELAKACGLRLASLWPDRRSKSSGANAA